MEKNQQAMERRRHPRTKLQMTLQGIRLDPDGGDVVDSLHMFDISRSGMGVKTRRSFYPGQRVVLCLPLSDHGGRRNIYATVIRCSKEQDGFDVGMEFDSVSLGRLYGGVGAVAAA
ncbi:MAG: PilZ domain-containing protein [Planctomycetota bacterium]|jgi:hypothetical protein